MDFKGLALDAFQVEAIEAIERGESVIVSAPTGAGKTVIAEFAIEKALRQGKEIIYTAPIKALSNQKYRDFSTDYPDQVGIMTGDVILNADAPVLIMTTEIFRNIIFDSGERLKNVEAVIFDEIHYINDIQRGTVWEESIIFAPQHISFVCLSATIPNFNEFADWMRGVRHKKIHTIVETRRPVPLKTSIWVPGFGFRDMKFLQKLEHETLMDRKKSRGRKFDLEPLVYHLRREDLMPCIFFHFSRLGCQSLALRFKGLNLLSSAERNRALTLYDESCERFGVTERANAIQMRGLVKNGVAYHHAGVLPAIKDILERLYTLGLIKLLFTTETFAVGMNLPAKSVVFENVMKHDGISFRYLTAREFQQMAGRAGRRGIDEVGYAISVINPLDFSVEGLKGTFAREVEDIESQFSLSYSSLLNLYDRFSDKIFDVCERSFNNFKNVYQVELLRERMRRMADDVQQLRKQDCLHGDFSQIERFLDLRKEFFKYTDQINKSRRGKKKRGSFELREKIEAVKNSLNDIQCQQCKRKKHCIGVMKKIRRHEQELSFMGEEAVEVENTQRMGIARRLELLRNLDYLNDDGLLPRGKIASQIFGYELQFTELYFEGMFEDLDEEGLCLLVSCIIFESRRGVPRRRIKEKNLQWIIDQADRTVRHLRNLEQQAGLPNRVDPLDTGMADTVIAWCRGANFEDLRAAHLDDGDLVRNFRLIVDFMRQMKRAINEPMFRDKVDRCVKLIYRDVVDAEAQLQTQV